MNNVNEKKVWATAAIIEAFNTDQTDETRESVLADGAEGLKDYALAVELDVENMELVDWDVAIRICADWDERELYRTATSAHVREYMGLEE